MKSIIAGLGVVLLSVSAMASAGAIPRDQLSDYVAKMERVTDFADRSQAISWNGSTRFHRSEPPNFMERIHL
jgi:hypothetical protein